MRDVSTDWNPSTPCDFRISSSATVNFKRESSNCVESGSTPFILARISAGVCVTTGIVNDSVGAAGAAVLSVDGLGADDQHPITTARSAWGAQQNAKESLRKNRSPSIIVGFQRCLD
jgi:hypothetical protein